MDNGEWVESALHFAAFAVGLVATAFLFYSYQKFGRGTLAEVVQLLTFGVTLLFMIHLIEEASMFFPLLKAFEGFGEHVLGIGGFILIAIGAHKLFVFSKRP